MGDRIRRHLDGAGQALRVNHFVRNVGWLTLSMLATRILRLGITVVVARTFTPLDYGQIALIFTAHEIIGLFIQRCTQVKLIQAPTRDLPSLCRTTYPLNWVLSLSLLAAQFLTGFLVATFYATPELWLPISLLGLSHLLLPAGMVQAALNVRAGKLQLVAKIEVAQTVAEATGVLLLIAAGMGIWSLVIPKIIAPLLWVLGHRAQNTWRFDRSIEGSSWREILRYSSNLLLVDGLHVVRQNLDYLLIGYFLGLEALGLYFFAFNAGLGIASTFANAINSALLPHLCNADGDNSDAQRNQRYRAGILMIAIVVGGLVCLQSVAAPFYVPLIFGTSWAAAGSIPLIVLLCLTALPKTLFEASSQYLRALDRPAEDLKCHAWLTLTLVASVSASVPFGLWAVAFATFVTYGVGAIVMMHYCRKPTLCEPSTSPQPHLVHP
ncbi:oligosaccharide flippase family protein [Marinobacter sp. F3R08]|uniref:oligosaccharide flippase family protein n=1 Tax=Marinobacter sp. F3R08 TaxID=2841559 RepID=UPI001C0A29EE|nr:oligosaccharide flippase family protein [Marinobacter sp. F3R08]MBU2955898.1 oligosaccharide flippase family protein [Marinobacter sp. F3R08]